MDDDEIRSAIQVLTDPRPAPPGARDQIIRRVVARRRQRGGRLAAAATVLVGVVTVSATVGIPGHRAFSPAGPMRDHAAPIMAGDGRRGSRPR